jgi:hypothetical protein
LRPSTRDATRALGAVFIVLAVVFVFWHLVLYWTLHPAMTWGQVLEVKQERVKGGVGLLLWGILGWALPSLGRDRKATPHATRYRIRKRGRRID